MRWLLPLVTLRGASVFSAKQTMLKNCPHCGAANRERANDCYVCESPLPELAPPDAPEPYETSDIADDLARDILNSIPDPAMSPDRLPQPVPTRAATVTEIRALSSSQTQGAPALADPPAVSEPEWKREVASKLEEYRSRRQRSEEPQSALPFSEETAAAEPHPRESLRTTARSRPQTSERMEISVQQPELDFDATRPSPQPSTRLVPVAQLGERVRSGLLDAAFIAITCGGFLLMFSYLVGQGGELSFGKVDAIVYGVAGFLIYGLYFFLFTAFGAATPGMLLSELHVVSFDGDTPTPQQLLWRSFGYLISLAAVTLGFLWALWDEDHLTWQDRISQTYLTEAPPEPIAVSDDSSFQSWKLL